jgi:predicted nucleic acid-binding protein
VGTPARIVVADANVIINLIHAEHLALLAAIPPYEFVIPDNVLSEITKTAQRAALEAAINAGYLVGATITEPAELASYAELRQVNGKGEAACLALAHSRGWLIASDEKGRFRREVFARLGEGRLVTTPGLFVLAIRAGAISIAEADHAKAILENHRFRLTFPDRRLFDRRESDESLFPILKVGIVRAAD